MQNEEGQKVDLYIPRKWYVIFPCNYYISIITLRASLSLIWFLCPILFIIISSYTNRLIQSKDHSSVQINVGHVDQNGVYTGEFTPFALCGFIRRKAAGDEAMNQLLTKKGFVKNVI